MIRSIVRGYGASLPKRVVTNREMESLVDTTDEWIVQRTGIRQRYIAGEGETTASLGEAAARAALDRAGLKPDDIDLIICATSTPDNTFPATAVNIQQRLGMTRGAAFDMPPDLADLVNGLSNNAATQNMMSGSGGPSGGLGIRFLCSFSLPVITICAMIMLSVIINLLNIFLGWMAWVKICLPLPSKR